MLAYRTPQEAHTLFLWCRSWAKLSCWDTVCWLSSISGRLASLTWFRCNLCSPRQVWHLGPGKHGRWSWTTHVPANFRVLLRDGSIYYHFCFLRHWTQRVIRRGITRIWRWRKAKVTIRPWHCRVHPYRLTVFLIDLCSIKSFLVCKYYY